MKLFTNLPHPPPLTCPQKEEIQKAAVMAEETRRREVSRAVSAYVAESEARRREEHGAGPLLEDLIRSKKVPSILLKKFLLVPRNKVFFLWLFGSDRPRFFFG